jgi:hypothetical protein
VGVVQVIGGTDAEEIDFCALAVQFFEVSIKAFKFRKKRGFGEIAVDYAYRVIFVERCYQAVAGGFDGL